MKRIIALMLMLICAPIARAAEYGPVVFYGNVSTGVWTAIDGITAAITSSGAYTNSGYTNYYRLCGTNVSGRLPLSTNVVITWTGSVASNNSVQLTWTRKGGILKHTIERSFDDGATWTNYLVVGPNTNTWTDTGANTWSVGDISSITLIPSPTFPWTAGDVAAAAAIVAVSGRVDGVTSSQIVDRAWLTLLDASQQVDRVMATGATSTGQTALALAQLTAGSNATAAALLDLTTGSGAVTRVMSEGATTTGETALAIAQGAANSGAVFLAQYLITSGKVDIVTSGLLALTGRVDGITLTQETHAIQLSGLTTTGETALAIAQGVVSSQQVDRAIIGTISNTLDNTRINPKYITQEASSELGNEQIAQPYDFYFNNNKMWLNPRYEQNIIDAQWRLSVLEGSSLYSLIDGYSDEFVDESGVYTSICVNALYSTNGYYVSAYEVSGSGYALTFDGSDDYILFPQSPGYANITGEMTIAFWFKSGASPGDYNDTAVFSMNNNRSSGLSIRETYDGGSGWRLVAEDYPVENYVYSSSDGANIPGGTWTHVILVLKFGTDTSKFFVNGDSSSTFYAGGGRTYSGTSARPPANGISFGAQESGGSPCNYSVDEIAIWNRALTPEECTNVYGGASGVYGNTGVAPWDDATLMLLTHVDSGSGTNVVDSSVTNNTGVFGGGTTPTWIEGEKASGGSLSTVATNMVLISTNLPLAFVPSTVRMSMRIQDMGTASVTNTDLFAYASANNRTNWEAIVWDTDKVLVNSNRFLSGMASLEHAVSTQLFLRNDITNATPKEVRIHAWDGRAN